MFAGTCNKCGRYGHQAKDCLAKDLRDVECFSCHEKRHYNFNCPKKGSETLMSTPNKKSKEMKVKGRAFQITEEEAKGTHDVVSGTLIINLLPARVI